jgi:peptidoglycan/xylan/chitin deacetylase (PgdA/CDA1 family)
LEYLVEDYNLLSAGELEYCLAHRGRFPDRSMVLMFDGGYGELLNTIQPVLDRLCAPAVAFIPTAGMVERRLRWYDELENLLIAAGASGDCELPLEDGVLTVSLHSNSERFTAYGRLLSLLSQKSPVEQYEILDQLTAALTVHDGESDNHSSLQAHQVSQLGQSGSLCIGGSTHHHADPDTLIPRQQWLEIGKNKEILEEVLRAPIRYFACPFWALHGPSAASVEMLWKLGFTHGFYNTPESMVVYTKSDHVTIPRVRAPDGAALCLHRQLARAQWACVQSKV